jgi:hypothetical protein
MVFNAIFNNNSVSFIGGGNRSTWRKPQTRRLSPLKFKVVSSNPVYGDMYSIQHYVIKFVKLLDEIINILDTSDECLPGIVCLFCKYTAIKKI